MADVYLTEGNDLLLIGVTYSYDLPFVVYALGGDDVILRSDFVGIGTAYLGSGNDYFRGTSADSPNGCTVFGDDGNDVIIGNYGYSFNATQRGSELYGGAGDDTIQGRSDKDTIYGGDGNDWITGSGGAYWGEAGDDVVIVSDSNAQPLFASGGTGNDTLYGSFLGDSISGNEGIDVLVGRSGDDWLYTDAGGGTAFGDFGNDVLVGAADSDTLVGGLGNDAFYGYAGRDWLYGEDGNDTLLAGDGNDVLIGGNGANYLEGGLGDDVFITIGTADQVITGDGHNYAFHYGISGGVIVTGGSGIDEFIGGDGASNDTVLGLAGNDYLYGGGGNDLLQGGADNDVILGQAGNDTLDGGSGVNLLWANDAGSDQILVNAGVGGTQVLEFFEAGGTNDVVRLLGSNLTNFAGIQNLVNNISTVQNGNFLTNAGSGAQLILGVGTATQTAIWFQGVSAYSLTAGDFLFG
jgi:Ca2+-binding RTX toxin-like protein